LQETHELDEPAPMKYERVPAGHTTQLVDRIAPVANKYLPAAQPVHTTVPVAAAY
jgi:hypothetical protein